jgi:hypothetical protein
VPEGWSEEDQAIGGAPECHPGELISGWEESHGEKDEPVTT